MSDRANAPRDRLEDSGTTLVSEGHDLPKVAGGHPKTIDQPLRYNYNGVCHLVDAWTERDDSRTVCKIKLIAVEVEEDFAQPVAKPRLISESLDEISKVLANISEVVAC